MIPVMDKGWCNMDPNFTTRNALMKAAYDLVRNRPAAAIQIAFYFSHPNFERQTTVFFNARIKNYAIIAVHNRKTMQLIQGFGSPCFLIHDPSCCFDSSTRISSEEQLAWNENGWICYAVQTNLSDIAPNQFNEYIFAIMEHQLFIRDFIDIQSDCPKIYFTDDNQPPLPERQITLIVDGGYGDAFIFAPVIQTFWEQKQAQGITVDLLVVEKHPQYKEIYHWLLPQIAYSELRRLPLSPSHMEQAVKSVRNKHYEFINILRYDVIAACCPVAKTSVFEMMCSEFCKDQRPGDIIKSFQSKLDVSRGSRSLLGKEYKYLIGFQRKSASRGIDEKTLSKELDVNLTRELIEMCHSNGIGIVNLEPTDPCREMYDYDVSSQSILQIIHLFHEIDAFVGIDSCFGHLSALLNVPNIICFSTSDIWLKVTCTAFMPVCKNYSLIPKELDAEQLTAKAIMNIIEKILTGELQLSDKFIPQKEKKPYQQYEWVALS